MHVMYSLTTVDVGLAVLSLTSVDYIDYSLRSTLPRVLTGNSSKREVL